MNAEETVSVIIPVYNQANYVVEAVESVLRQSVKPREVIIVDDGSTDQLRLAISPFREQVSLIEQDNQGVSSARNHGAARASGLYLAFLDADDVWHADKLKMQLSMFQAQPDLGLVDCMIQEIDVSGHTRGRIEVGQAGWIRDELLLRRRPAVVGGGSGLLTPRRVFDEVGGFDSALSTAADWDFFYRVACRYPIGFVNEVLVDYRIHGNNMHMEPRKYEADILYALDKAFSQEDAPSGLKRRAYARAWLLAGRAYMARGKYAIGISRVGKALATWPLEAGPVVAGAVRRAAKRVRPGGAQSSSAS